MIDLIEDYTWADEDCDLLTKTQIEYHKGVRFYRYSEGTKLCCPKPHITIDLHFILIVIIPNETIFLISISDIYGLG